MDANWRGGIPFITSKIGDTRNLSSWRGGKPLISFWPLKYYESIDFLGNSMVQFLPRKSSMELYLYRLIDALDNVLLSIKNDVSIQIQDSSINTINFIRLSKYGVVQDQFKKGVIFGVELLPLLKTPISWSIFEGPDFINPSLRPMWSEGDTEKDWIVYRGNLYDGEKIVNIDLLKNKCYAYKVELPESEGLINCYAFGNVVYKTEVGFQTVWKGKENDWSAPVVVVDKDNITKEELLDNAFNDCMFIDTYYPELSQDEILIGRIVLDINNLLNNDYEIIGKNCSQLYPFPCGQPCGTYLKFASNISGFAKNKLNNNYDIVLAYTVLNPIVSAKIWGVNGFYGHWSQAGMVLPENVKYYYNQIYDPPII